MLRTMAMLGLGLFVVMFLMITPKSRGMLSGAVSGAGDWIVKYAPLSYLVVAVLVLVPLIGAIVVMRWPEPPKPEDPLAKYRGGEDVLED